MATEETLPESLEKLEIDSQSLLDSDNQPSLESLSFRGDDCSRESCKCNSRSKVPANNAWNFRHLNHKAALSVNGYQKGGIIKKSRFKSGKTWILREPILKLNSQSLSKEQQSTSSSIPLVHLDTKTSNLTSEHVEGPSDQMEPQGRVFGACTSVPHSDFSSLYPTKSPPAEGKVAKLFTATSYRCIRSSTNVSPKSQHSKVPKRKNDVHKEESVKPSAVSESTNSFLMKQTQNQLSGSQSTTCSQQARMVGQSHVSSNTDDVTIDELASYFDLFVHIPRKMSHMAENMYI